ncbi:hypothetical protein Tco_1127179 [Tanacetum coccineum]
MRFREDFRGKTSLIHPCTEDLQADVALRNGKREARAATNLLWEMEQYSKGVNNVDEATYQDQDGDFKKQFRPKNAKNEAKIRLCKLKHPGTNREYVKALIDFGMKREPSKPKDRRLNLEKGREEKKVRA